MSEPIISIKQGQIKGITDINLDGEIYYKFLGIPFAKPPVGPLRFKAPEAPESWTQIRDCTKGGEACLCYIRQRKEYVGSEDCLYLNVFTKQLPKNTVKPKPVMFWIHGGAGGFTLGSGSEEMNGARYLLTEDIVLVTINYRVGVLGFLSTDDPSLEVPGNAGLKDQTFALKWVQENIASFNGDPNNVTIFGVSAGGASVSFQMLSPSAKGLFHKAIAQSGCVLSPWAWGKKNSIELAEKLGEKVSTEKEALNILVEVPARELIESTLKLTDLLMLDASGRRPFGPVIETPNPTAFLSENPFDSLASGRYNQVPIIQGLTSNEGMLSETTAFGPVVEARPECGLIWHLNLNENEQKSKEMTKLLKEFYFKNGITKEATYKFVGDVNGLQGIMESTNLLVRTSAHPVYFYVYSNENALSNVMRKICGVRDDNIRGVAHGAEATVLFETELLKFFGVRVTEETKYSVKQIVKMWTDFARTGKPHQDWYPVTNVDNLAYFDIDKEAKLKNNPFADRVAFWKDLLRNVTTRDARLKEK